MLELIDVVWLCYDYGIYTVEIATQLSTSNEALQYVPTEGTLLEDMCANIYDSYGV